MQPSSGVGYHVLCIKLPLISYMSHVTRNGALCHMRTTKVQISLCGCAFVVRCLETCSITTYTCWIQNFKTLTSLCSRFESYLVGNFRRQVFLWHGSYYPLWTAKALARLLMRRLAWAVTGRLNDRYLFTWAGSNRAYLAWFTHFAKKAQIRK